MLREREDTNISASPWGPSAFQEVGEMLGQSLSLLSLCCSALLGGIKLDVILSKTFHSLQP